MHYRNPISDSRKDLLQKRLVKRLKKLNRSDDLELISRQLDIIGEADPTRSGKYCEWILKLIIANRIILPEDSQKMHDALKVFDKIRGRLPKDKRDINSYRSFQELYSTIEEYLPKSKSKKDLEKEGTIEYVSAPFKGWRYEIDPYLKEGFFLMYKLITPEAASKAAQNTGWCVCNIETAKNYLEKGPLFLLMEKRVYDNNSKQYEKVFLAHFDSKQVMDKKDVPLHPKKLDSLDIVEFLKFHKKESMIEAAKERYYDDVVEIFDNTTEELKQFICNFCPTASDEPTKYGILNIFCSDCSENNIVCCGYCSENGEPTNRENDIVLCSGQECSYGVCAVHHLVCDDCDERYCDQCAEHALDDKDVCENCAVHCNNCGSSVLAEQTAETDYGEYCFNCYEHCDNCHEPTPHEGILHCDSCYESKCLDCFDTAYNCRTCYNYTCSDCRVKCYVCEERACPGCTTQCMIEGCNNNVCPECSDSQPECSHCHLGPICDSCEEEETTRCSVCENTVCSKPSCSVKCSECELTSCHGCYSECSSCDNKCHDDCIRDQECNVCSSDQCNECAQICESCAKYACKDCIQKGICEDCQE